MQLKGQGTKVFVNVCEVGGNRGCPARQELCLLSSARASPARQELCLLSSARADAHIDPGLESRAPQSDVIQEPKASKTTQGGQTGTAWSLPHSLTAHREDVDKQGKPCIVYDAVFHPQALRLAQQDGRFKEVRQWRWQDRPRGGGKCPMP